MKTVNLSLYKSLLLLVVLYVVIPCTCFAQKEWELVKNKDGIAIYKRNATGSSLKELKVISNFESNLSGFVSFIRDVPAQPSYMYSCVHSKLIKEISEKELIFYQQLKGRGLLPTVMEFTAR